MEKGTDEKVTGMNIEKINIAICDDEKRHREKLIELIKAYCKEREKMAVISEYSSGEECLSDLDEVEMLFLDIDMEGIDGIEVKNRLESAHVNISIIFTTNYGDRMDEAFGMQVVSFIEKPVTLEPVANAMDRILKWYSQRELIEVENSGGKKNVLSTEQIYYIEASNQYSRIRLRKEEILLRKSLKAWEEELSGKGFCRIHQSVIVNFSHVKEMGQRVLMEDDTAFTVSTRRRKTVNLAYSEYLRKMLLE